MTLFIVIVTFVISIMAFNRPELVYRYNLSPYQIVQRKQYFRLLSHAFLHADWMHLIVNMLVLYSFGDALIIYFNIVFQTIPGWLLFIIFYALSIVVSSIVTVVKERNNFQYNALGASGAVSAVVFACIFFAPVQKILFFGIIPIPGILFGIGYLIYSWYMGKQNRDNIGHDAHFYGAVFGFIFPLLLKPQLIQVFVHQIINW